MPVLHQIILPFVNLSFRGFFSVQEIRGLHAKISGVKKVSPTKVLTNYFSLMFSYYSVFSKPKSSHAQIAWADFESFDIQSKVE